MQVGDIRPLKNGLRDHYKTIRRDMPPEVKYQHDQAVLRRVTNLWQYKCNSLLLTYVSTAIEVDTLEIINKALSDGKKVAVPRCVPGTRNMEFYFIDGLDALSPGTFGVLEPRPEKKKLVTDFSSGLCLVPALCYDWKGYRLGYGKGYYDRFLAQFGGNMVGICYHECIRRWLPHGRYDRPVELLVTDRYLRRTGDSNLYTAKP